MKKIFLMCMVLVLFPVFAFANTLYDGYLTTNPINNFGVIATVPWNDDFRIDWKVTQTGNIFHYSYKITNESGNNLEKDMSHFIFQVSDNFTLKDISNFSGGVIAESPKTYSVAPSNPNMPNPIFGIKVEDFSNPAKPSFEFDSTRMPMWGNFYTKDGIFQSGEVTAWNTALEFKDGVSISVPDTKVVPIPGGILLFMVGASRMIISMRKRCLN